MSDDDPDFDEIAADMALDASQAYEENLADQEDFLDTVAEEEGAEVLETQCNLIGEFTVPLKAKLNGEIMDELGHIHEKLERLEDGDGAAYEISEAADQAAQLLADVIDDPSWHKSKFYKAYEAEGLDPIGVMIERVFDALRNEQDRRRGTADGFRPDSGGA